MNTINSRFSSPPHVEVILSRLERVREIGHGKWEALCPSHDDHRPSLAITDTGDKALLTCWAGCQYDQIMAVLGLPQAAGFANFHDRADRVASLHRAIEGDYKRPHQKPVAVIDDKTTRRIRQANNLYRTAEAIESSSEIVAYLQGRGIDPAMAAAAGARATRIPRANLKEDQAPVGWINGENAAAILWPIHHPHDILKTGKRRMIGVQREYPWGRDGGPRSVKAILGKRILNKESGGFLIGSLEGAHTLYIVSGMLTGIAVHGATGQPVLVLICDGGLRAIGKVTIEDIAKLGLHVVIAGDNDRSGVGQAAAQVCAEKILLTAPAIPVSITIPVEAGTDWLDVLVTGGREGCKIALAANMRRPIPPPTRGPNGGKPKPLPGNDMLSMPDLSGGPLGPEPPPIEYQQPRNVISIVPWWPRTDLDESDESERELPIHEAQINITEILKKLTPIIREEEFQGPAIVVGTVGVSKSTTVAHLIAHNHDAHRVGCASNDAADAMCAAIPGAYRLKGRSKDTCFKWGIVKALQDQARGPAPWVCKANGGCPHWGSEAEKPCPYSLMVETARYMRVCVGVHSQFEEDSSFFEFWRNPGDKNKDNAEDVRLWSDESPPLTTKTKIDPDAIRVWREGVTRARAALPKLREAAAYDKYHHPVDEVTHEKNLKQVAKAEKWIDAMEPVLDQIALALAAAKTGAGIELLDAERFAELVKLGTHIPIKARQKDATLIEGCVLSHASDPIIPLRGIEALAAAIINKTAWFQKGKIVAGNPAKFWQRIVACGTLLDATPAKEQIEEVEAHGGHVFTIRVQQPTLKRIKLGPKLHGKGGLRRTDGVKLETERAELLAAMADGPDPVVGTHKALAETFYPMDKGPHINEYVPGDRVRHYGMHKGHNDWSGEKRLISWGPHLSNADDLLIDYHCGRRAVIEAGGREWDDWQGETARNMEVLTDTHIERHSIPLPTSKDALEWLQNRVTGDLVQLEGRLRAVWAKGPVVHETYGFFPYKGHGYKVDEIRLERTGRLPAKVKTLQTRAQAVVTLGADAPRRAVSDFMYSIDGIRHSNATIDCLMDELRADALESGITLDQSARKAIATTRRVLDIKASGGDFDTALTEVYTDTSHAMQAVAIILTATQQGQAPGAQRAGP